MALTLTFQMKFMLCLAVAMIVLFIWDKWRSDIVAMLVLVILGIAKLIPTDQLLSGFSSNAVVAIIAVMMLGAGLERSGLISSLANWIFRVSRDEPSRFSWILGLTAGVMSGFLRSIGGFTLLLPIINRASMSFRIPKSRFLMPIGFCAIAGGTLTLIGSGPLLMLNDLMNNPFTQSGLTHPITIIPIKMFTVMPVGLCLLAVSLGYFYFFGKWLVPDISKDKLTLGADVTHFRRTYGFGGQFFELTIPSDNPISHMKLSQLESLLHGKKIAVVALSNGREILMPPLRSTEFNQRRHIAVVGFLQDVADFCQESGLLMAPKVKVFADALNPTRSGFSEVVIPPGSELIGKKMRELHMRRNYQVQLLSIYRNGQIHQGEELRELTLSAGDTLGLFSAWQSLARLDKRHEFAIITTDYPNVDFKPEKRYQALIWLVLSLLLTVVFRLPAAIGLMFGAVGMFMTGVISPDETYRVVSWKTVFMLAGLIPFGLAMQSTGTASWIADQMVTVLQAFPAWMILTGLAALAAVFSLLMSNIGATVVLVPIAMHLAIAIGADPRLFAIVVALGTSNAFLMPTHQVSTIISGSGGYRTKHFLVVGGILSLLYLAVLIPSAYLFLN
ncbi:MAG: SLC13 family permease [Gammaproteobacteria bacterium]|nr:SLC13 family permease [Gammaproteobacteria bacterium]